MAKKDVEAFVAWQEKIAKDNSHGYDQAHRNGPDYDCSSLCGTALNKAGFNVSPSSTTRNLRAQLLADGWTYCKPPWRRGDIHLKESSHVVTSVDANNIVHASINENGGITGGKTGDQTGKEICIRPYYDKPWDYHLRYTGGLVDAGTSNPDKGVPIYKVGATYTLQSEMKVRRGPATTYAAKSHKELTKDGRKNDKDGDGCLDKGTRITCQEIRKEGKNLWIKIPSGWVAAYHNGKVYIR